MQRFPKYIFTVMVILGLTGFGGISNAAAQSDQSQAGKQRVARGLFSTNIIDREPVDQVVILTTAVNQVYFYTDLRNYQGQTITHRWEFEGKLVTEKKFEVGGSRWRIYSQKDLNPTMTGTWTVVVSDGRGWPIYAAIFQYVKKISSNSRGIILPIED
ncbi:MAG: DUF2914 domain-containing protein [Halobacteria archaeon]|nr:DUF2914 domain-containing protein [Halobacteria archaeon]